MPALSRFAKFAWFMFAYILATVAWGAVVRATFSGDGCGSHWPLCDGQIIPEFARLEQVFEFSHRVTSGLILPMAIALVVLARRNFEPGHYGRSAAYAVLALTILEGAIGAGLVLFGLVDTNDSIARAGVMAFHTVSTYLLASVSLMTALAASGAPKFRWRGQGSLGVALGIALVSLMVLGVSGAVSALGHTLKPHEDVLRAVVAENAHWMVRLQPLHPALATGIGLYLALVGLMVLKNRRGPGTAQAVRWMLAALGVQMLCGAVNVWTKAPVAMQAVHLVLADIQFATVVSMGMYAFQLTESAPVPSSPSGKSFREWVSAYLSLTKPRVISLLLFTCLAAAFTAAKGFPGWGVFFGLLVGGYLMPGAANAINMVIDRDIDQRMERTAKRPTASSEISSEAALAFAFLLAIASFGVLWWASNLLTAMLALSGLVFYVVIYTLLLKRRTWQNIVIGGAAGCFPPLVGWSAVDNSLGALAWILFAIIFVWTPVHFWALALLIKDDYAAAGVPMLPVVKGDRATVEQIAAYTAVTVLVTLIPYFLHETGWIYLTGAIALNVWLVRYCVRLWRNMGRQQASALFHYSMLYLAALFLVVAIDKVVLS
jgi:protoheme IX farnesyltransferase